MTDKIIYAVDDTAAIRLRLAELEAEKKPRDEAEEWPAYVAQDYDPA